MSDSNCCFLACIQISQEAGQVFWYSLLFKKCPHLAPRLSPAGQVPELFSSFGQLLLHRVCTLLPGILQQFCTKLPGFSAWPSCDNETLCASQACFQTFLGSDLCVDCGLEGDSRLATPLDAATGVSDPPRGGGAHVQSNAQSSKVGKRRKARKQACWPRLPQPDHASHLVPLGLAFVCKWHRRGLVTYDPPEWMVT